MTLAPFTRFAGFRRRAGRVVARAAVAAATCAATVAPAADPPPAASVYVRRGPAVVAPAGDRIEDEAQAERIVTGALLALDRADPFVARIRQKAWVGNRVLIGSGRYVQAGVGETQRFRFESRLECVSESTSTRSEPFESVAVCDGLFLWNYRRSATDPPALERIDVRRVREKLEQLKIPDLESASRYLGGLQRTLWSTREWFQFQVAESADLDGLPAWRVEGRWHPERLVMTLPDLAAAARRPGGIEPHELPEGVPWGVRLWIGRADLLPRRVEWIAIPGDRPVTAAEPEPIAVLDIHDIEVGGRVKDGTFFYKPAGAGLMDVTEDHIKRLFPWRH
ncbi:MAG: hypothetical protein ACKOSQ_11710 [Planctomycetaceae bacterium]